MMYAVVSVESGCIRFISVDRDVAASYCNIENQYFSQCVLLVVPLEKLIKWGDELLDLYKDEEVSD